jgi:hypothetical protein
MQAELRQAISVFPEERLDALLTAEGSSAYNNFHGHVQHNAYHAGQISLLKKANLQAVEIVEEIGVLIDKVWYNRHKVREEQVEAGEIKIGNETGPDSIKAEIREGARRSAKKVEEKYGIENVGPWNDFEWGMMNGKLSALRWVLGEEWDSLYT